VRLFSQEDKVQVEKNNEKLHKITLSLNDFTVNIGLCVGVDGKLVIDTGWTQTAEALNEGVRELDDGRVKLIIITHPHGDHIGGMGLLGEDALLIAHENAKDELAGKYYGLEALPGQELPIITLEDELSIRFNREEIRIFPAPGHTHSDLVVHFINSNVAFLGDVVLSDIFPPLDFARGGNAELYVESLEKLIALFPTDIKFITGHGRDYSMEDLKEHHRMATSTMELIKQRMSDGKSAQDMVSEDLLKDWESWSRPQLTSETWITQAYESLSGQGKKPISEVLTYTIVEKGIKAAIEQYAELKTNHPDSYIFVENELNMLGYQLMWREMNEEAIEIFKLNIQSYPESANPYDSLGEAYEKIGDHERAIEMYEKAVALDPNMTPSVEALRKLKGTDKE
jgi:glyoxylase-like metal-dependent hydrolase (beta-lactamase superfamily II)